VTVHDTEVSLFHPLRALTLNPPMSTPVVNVVLRPAVMPNIRHEPRGAADGGQERTTRSLHVHPLLRSNSRWGWRTLPQDQHSGQDCPVSVIIQLRRLAQPNRGI
jgi:hypothetical protein